MVLVLRQIFFDIETTGLDFKKGHKIIEIAAIEVVDRKTTGKFLHYYFNPNRDIDNNSFKVHGISNVYLLGCCFIEKSFDYVMSFLNKSELVVHNSSFDIDFFNWELNTFPFVNWSFLEKHCVIFDTLVIARDIHFGQRNSLDALSNRYNIKNIRRFLHGSLVDSEILFFIYLAMTGGQIDFVFDIDLTNENKIALNYVRKNDIFMSVLNLYSNRKDNFCHKNYLNVLDKHSKNKTIWRIS